MFVRKVGVFDEDGNPIAEFPTVTAAADELGMGTTAVINRIKGRIKDKDNRIFRYLSETMVAPKPKPRTQPKPRKAVEDGECVEMPYTLRYGIVCITPCRFKPDKMVASALCKKCFMFRGMDRERNVVYCSCKGRKTNEDYI